MILFELSLLLCLGCWSAKWYHCPTQRSIQTSVTQLLSPPESPTGKKPDAPFLPFFSLLGHQSGSLLPVGTSRSHRKVLIPLFILVLPQRQGVTCAGAQTGMESSPLVW